MWILLFPSCSRSVWIKTLYLALLLDSSPLILWHHQMFLCWFWMVSTTLWLILVRCTAGDQFWNRVIMLIWFRKVATSFNSRMQLWLSRKLMPFSTWLRPTNSQIRFPPSPLFLRHYSHDDWFYWCWCSHYWWRTCRLQLCPLYSTICFKNLYSR